MKTKLTALLLAAALTLTLAACGEKDIADTPLPDEPPEPVAEQPAADDEWTVLHADDVLLRTEPFTLCEGRTATLRLYGYQNGEYDCGVSRASFFSCGTTAASRRICAPPSSATTSGVRTATRTAGQRTAALRPATITLTATWTSVCKSTRPPTTCPIITGSTTRRPPAFSLMAAGPISLRLMRKMRRASANGMSRPSITPTPTVPMGKAGCTSRGATRRFTTARTG